MERSQDSFDLMESFFEALDGVKQVAYHSSEKEQMEEEREEREGNHRE